MAFVEGAVRVKETTSTLGSGPLSLNGAVTGNVSFVSGIGTGSSCYYYITDGTDFEHGVGTVTSGSPDTLSRDVVLESSNSDTFVNWGSGSKDVWVADAPIKSRGGSQCTIYGVGSSRNASTIRVTIWGDGNSNYGSSSTVLGAANVGNSSTNTVVAGYNCRPGGTDVLIGIGTATAGPNSFNAGSASTPYTTVVFGAGPTATSVGTQVNYTIRGTDATNTADLLGGGLNLAGGVSTGTGTPGPVKLRVAPATAGSGTTQNTLVDGIVVSADTTEVLIGFFPGTTPAAQQAHIADPSGGLTQDAEARTAINAILDLLEAYGLAKTS